MYTNIIYMYCGCKRTNHSHTYIVAVRDKAYIVVVSGQQLLLLPLLIIEGLKFRSYCMAAPNGAK